MVFGLNDIQQNTNLEKKTNINLHRVKKGVNKMEIMLKEKHCNMLKQTPDY